MSFHDQIFHLFELLCASPDMPSNDTFQECPAKLKNCICCLVDTLIIHRLKQTQSPFTELLEKLKSEGQFASWAIEADFSHPKVEYIANILSIIRLLSLNADFQKESLSSSEKRLLSFAFDAFFYVEVLPLLPAGVVSPLDKRLPLDSSLRLSSTYSHFPPDKTESVRLLDRHLSVFVESLLSCKILFYELISFSSGQHFEDLVGALSFLAESPSAKQILGEERCSFWLKKLEEEILPIAPVALVIRILLTNLNRCNTGSSQSKNELMFATVLYGRFLSKMLISNKDGVQNFLEVFMETSGSCSFEELSQAELWKRSLAVAAVLIRCPTFAKPSEYYSSIVKQLVRVLDNSIFFEKSFDPEKPPTFPAFVIGALLLQSQLIEKKNAVLAGKLSKILRRYFFPVLVEPFVKLDPNFRISLLENCSVANLSSLPRISFILSAIPDTIWNQLDLGDIHFFLRSFVPVALEIFSSFHENTLLSGQVVPLCQKVFSRFVATFPVAPNSQSADLLAGWLMRPVLPVHLEFEQPLVVSADASPFEFGIVEQEVPVVNVELRLTSVRSVLNYFDRNHYVCAIWSLLLSLLRRLLLFTEMKNESNSLSNLYTLLGSLSEEVAEFSEELRNLIIAPERFNILVDFVGVLCDRLLLLSEDKDPTIGPILERTISLSLSIVSSVVVSKPEDPEVAKNLSTLKSKLEPLVDCRLLSSECKEILKAFLAMLEPEKVAERSKNEKIESLKVDNSMKLAVGDISDPMCAIKGHGLIAARRLVDSKEHSISEETVPDLFQIFFQCLCHDDSYVHLNAAAALTSLGLRFHQRILPDLAALYAGRSIGSAKIGVDVRIRIGECICRIIRGLGDLAPIYRDILLESCLVAVKAKIADDIVTDEEEKEEIVVKMRSSALSTLGQLAGALRFSLASNSGEVLTCMSSFLASRSEHLEVRRAAACSLVLLLRGFGEDRSQIIALADILRDIGRILRQNKTTSLDEVILQHIDLGLVEIDRLGRLLFEPEHELRNLMKKPILEL